MPVDGDPDPKARGPQETPDKPESNTEVGRAAGWIECGVIRGGGVSAVSARALPPLQGGNAPRDVARPATLSPHRCVFLEMGVPETWTERAEMPMPPASDPSNRVGRFWTGLLVIRGFEIW